MDNLLLIIVGVAVILAREIIVSGFRMVAADSGIVIAADIIGKYKTVMQDIAVIVIIIGAGFAELVPTVVNTAFTMCSKIINYVGLGCFAISVILTIISGINYIVKNIEVLKK